MKKKSIITLIILTIVLIIVARFAYFFYIEEKEDTPEETPISEELQLEEIPAYEMLNFFYDYLGEDLWTYEVTGLLPNPCYEISTEVDISEGEEGKIALIIATITPPEPDMVCAEVIQEVHEGGEFESGEDIEVSFKITE